VKALDVVDSSEGAPSWMWLRVCPAIYILRLRGEAMSQAVTSIFGST
jgi:hypothetical protein